MAILPVDLQALLLRLGDASRPHQREAEGAILTQLTKAEEAAKQAQIDSSRVNEVKPHPDQNSKIEPDGRGRQRSSGRGSGRGGGKSAPEKGAGTLRESPRQAPGEACVSDAAKRVDIEHPYKGSIIDTKV